MAFVISCTSTTGTFAMFTLKVSFFHTSFYNFGVNGFFIEKHAGVKTSLRPYQFWERKRVCVWFKEKKIGSYLVWPPCMQGTYYLDKGQHIISLILASKIKEKPNAVARLLLHSSALLLLRIEAKKTTTALMSSGWLWTFKAYDETSKMWHTTTQTHRYAINFNRTL